MRASDIVHVLFGVLAPLLNQEWLLTLIYITYQLIDFIGDEDIKEIKNDIIEYAVGLLIGFSCVASLLTPLPASQYCV
jgi:hypothetical protein